MTLPPRLDRELKELRKGHEIDVIEGPDWIDVIFKAFPLGNGFSQASAELLLRVPRSYPDAGPDMFWVSQEVVLAGGRIPQAADAMESHLGRIWRRFSWHRQQGWNPTHDDLQGHMEFIRHRLEEAK